MKLDPSPSVLIVEDDADLADLFVTFLPDEFTTNVAYSATEAIEQIDAALDVIILDRELQDHPGRAVVDHLRTEEIDCRIIIVSGYAESNGEPIEYDAYLQKPVSGAELVKAVKLVFDSTHSLSEVPDV